MIDIKSKDEKFKLSTGNARLCRLSHRWRQNGKIMESHYHPDTDSWEESVVSGGHNAPKDTNVADRLIKFLKSYDPRNQKHHNGLGQLISFRIVKVVS